MSVDAAVNGVYDSVDNIRLNYITRLSTLYNYSTWFDAGNAFDYSYQTFTGELTGFTHELSYGTTVSGVDVGLVLGKNSDDSTGDAAKKKLHTQTLL